MTEHPVEKSVAKKLEEAAPNTDIRFTSDELKVLRGFARFLTGSGVVFGSLKQVALFVTAVAAAVVIFQNAWGWLVDAASSMPK